MDVHGWIALATLAGATYLFIRRPIPLGISALAIPVVLVTTGVLSDPKQALLGFGNHAVISIGAIFIIGAGLRESGVATIIARGLQRVGGRSELGLVMLMMSATAILAAFMNNTAVVAILLPVGMALSRRANLAPSRLLMPISFAAVLGGTISMIGTAPNFIVADYYNNGDFDGKIGIFDFANVGIPITVVGVVFMAIFGRRLLPTVKTEDRLAAAQLPEQVASNYGVPDKLFMIRIAKSSAIVGKTIVETDIRNKYGLDVVMVRRGAALGQRWLQPDPDLRFEADDHLYCSGPDEAAWDFCETEELQFGLADDKAMDEIMSHGATLAEVTLTPHSPAIGRTFKSMDFRKRFGLNVLALFRGQEVLREKKLADLELSLGDAFLVSGSARHVRQLSAHPDFVVLTDQSQVEDITRAPLALGIMMLALVPPIALDFPLPISAMGAAILMILTRCISRSGLRRAMDWNVLLLLIGTLPLGLALTQTGIDQLAADWITGIVSDKLTLFAVLFVIAAAFSMLASNAAAAVIVAPVAIAAADTLSIDPKAALLAMAYGCSCNFIVPYSQCNLIVMAPGGYKAVDFVKAGLVLSVVMAVTTVVVLAIMG